MVAVFTDLFRKAAYMFNTCYLCYMYYLLCLYASYVI